MRLTNRRRLAIMGASGLLGADLVTALKPFYIVTSITKQNYKRFKGRSFDIFINANGNSKRFWANLNPVEDFAASTDSVIRSIFDFPCGIYIYISSPDVYINHSDPKFTKENAHVDPEKLEPYGLHKHLSELIVKKYAKKYLILRSANILGSNLKKGPIYDALNSDKLFITLRSQLQFISAFAIAEIIETLLKKPVKNEVVNVGGQGTFSFGKLEKLVKKKLKVSANAKTQIYEMNINKIKRIYPSLKTSEEYLQEYLLK